MSYPHERYRKQINRRVVIDEYDQAKLEDESLEATEA
nr:MAG: hypothetical protein [flactilig virus 17]